MNTKVGQNFMEKELELESYYCCLSKYTWYQCTLNVYFIFIDESYSQAQSEMILFVAKSDYRDMTFLNAENK